MMTILHLVRVHHVAALVVANLIMMNLQTAREMLSQMDKVWMMLVKWAWNNMNTPHNQDH